MNNMEPLTILEAEAMTCPFRAKPDNEYDTKCVSNTCIAWRWTYKPDKEGVCALVSNRIPD